MNGRNQPPQRILIASANPLFSKGLQRLFAEWWKTPTPEVRLVSSGAKNPLDYTDHNGFGETSDISGFAALAGNKTLTILIYNHHDDWDLQASNEIALTIENLPFASQPLTLHHYRIDAEHSNAYSEWLRQGKPIYPAHGQRAAIKARDGLELLEAPRQVSVEGSKVCVNFGLPVHGVSLLVLADGALD